MPNKEGKPGAPLTRREKEVLLLKAQGHTNKQIADALFISLGTTKTHVEQVLDKYEAGDFVRATFQGLDQGDISIEDLTDKPNTSNIRRLSPAEHQVIEVVVRSRGKVHTPDELGKLLDKGKKTIKTHYEHVYRKLGTSSLIQAAVVYERAHKDGYFNPSS